MEKIDITNTCETVKVDTGHCTRKEGGTSVHSGARDGFMKWNVLHASRHKVGVIGKLRVSVLGVVFESVCTLISSVNLTFLWKDSLLKTISNTDSSGHLLTRVINISEN